ncbi:MAG TPA: type II toxin-antitoxin system HicA family toxin [bacterium]|nr:type II toxin-antitoxin system HicA family toxin [bacterium]
MSRLPVMKGREVISVLNRVGFRELRRSKGSHVQLGDDNGRRVTVPDHGSADICCGLMQKIIQGTGMTKEEFLSYTN